MTKEIIIIRVKKKKMPIKPSKPKQHRTVINNRVTMTAMTLCTREQLRTKKTGNGSTENKKQT